MAKKKVVEVSEIENTIVETYTNEFRVYTGNDEFTSFETMDEAKAEQETNGGSITVASVK